MIYLMESHDKLKIGYAKDIKKRYRTLSTGNIDLTIKNTKPGTIKDEKLLQKKCLEWKINREWYQNVPEVIKAFEEYDPYDPENPEIKEFVESVKQFVIINCKKEWDEYEGHIKQYENILEKENDAPNWLKKYILYAKNITAFNTARDSICGSFAYYTKINPNSIKLAYKIADDLVIRPNWDDILQQYINKCKQLSEEIQTLIESIEAIQKDLPRCKSITSIEILQNGIKSLKSTIYSKKDSLNNFLEKSESLSNILTKLVSEY